MSLVVVASGMFGVGKVRNLKTERAARGDLLGPIAILKGLPGNTCGMFWNADGRPAGKGAIIENVYKLLNLKLTMIYAQFIQEDSFV